MIILNLFLSCFFNAYNKNTLAHCYHKINEEHRKQRKKTKTEIFANFSFPLFCDWLVSKIHDDFESI